MSAVMSLDDDLQRLLSGIPNQHGLIHVDARTSGDDSFKPVTNRTVCYIVCGLIFNENGEILMMQEAKSSCYGMWYLPAGRMEQNESIQEAVKREVLEETGMEVQSTTLLAVEVASGFWYRFTLLGHVTGGKLKSYEHRDRESLQAKWCSVETVKSGRKGFPLRASDILPLIDLGLSYRGSQKMHADLLPFQTAHHQLLLRLVCCHLDEGDFRVIVSKSPEPHFPIGSISVDDSSLYFAIFRIMKEIFVGPLKPTPSVKGVLSVEYSGKPASENDGMCLTLLILIHSAEAASQQPWRIKNPVRYDWHYVNKDDLRTQLHERIVDGLCVPLLLLR